MSAPGLPPEAYERVCSLEEIKAKRKLLARLSSGRGILLMFQNDRVTCCDHLCYHHGAPLFDGDIEDIGGVTCIICPWHKYKISIDSGQCLYIGIDIATKSQEVKSKGTKQRVHFVDIRGDDVFVADSTALTVPDDAKLPIAVGSVEYPSDVYAARPFNVGSKPEGSGSAGVPIHSSILKG